MEKQDFKNWKLKEIKGKFHVVSNDSVQFIKEILLTHKLPLPQNIENGLYKEDTNIDWSKMNQYYKFLFDKIENKDNLKKRLINSEIGSSKKLIVTYGWNEPSILVSTKLFIDDWEGFIRSTLWETIIFSEDYKFIMEVSRDYYLHSNFEIIPNTRVIF